MDPSVQTVTSSWALFLLCVSSTDTPLAALSSHLTVLLSFFVSLAVTPLSAHDVSPPAILLPLFSDGRIHSLSSQTRLYIERQIFVILASHPPLKISLAKEEKVVRKVLTPAFFANSVPKYWVFFFFLSKKL